MCIRPARNTDHLFIVNLRGKCSQGNRRDVSWSRDNAKGARGRGEENVSKEAIREFKIYDATAQNCKFKFVNLFRHYVSLFNV